MSVNLMVMFIAKSGQEGDVETSLRAMIEPTRSEPGCITYRLFRSGEDPRVFGLFEIYHSQTDLESHRASQHFEKHIKNGVISNIESRTVLVGSEITP